MTFCKPLLLSLLIVGLSACGGGGGGKAPPASGSSSSSSTSSSSSSGGVVVPQDTDGDGVSDSEDAFPEDPDETLDTDGDGVGDNSDPDKDGDGVINEDDLFPLDAAEWADMDADGIGDNTDADIDGDEVANELDAFPLDSSEWADVDGDGIGNNADETPLGDPMPMWHTYQGNALHNGFVPVSIDVSVISERWSAPSLTSQVRHGVAGDGYMFVTAGNTLTAFNAANGEIVWSKELLDAGPPAYAMGTVYVQTHDNSNALLAFDAVDGSLVFKSQVSYSSNNMFPPVVYGNAVYVSGSYNDNLFAISAINGEHQWQVYSNQYQDFTPAITDDYVVVYSATYNSKLNVFNRVTGDLAFDIPDPNGDTDFGRESVQVVSGDAVVVINNNRLIKFDLAARQIAWEIHDEFHGQVSIANGQVFCFNGEAIETRSLIDGSLVSNKTGYQGFNEGLLVTNNLLFAHGAPGIVAFDLESREEVWSRSEAGNFILAEGALYILSSSSVTALNVEGDLDGDSLPDWWEKRFGDIDSLLDQDGDGLSAVEEFTYRTNPLVSDTDGDGLNDSDEVNAHETSPLIADSDGDTLSDNEEVATLLTDPNLADSDGDGLNDNLEIEVGLDPLDASDAEADTDGDGYTNRHEALAGTDIHAVNSVPVLTDWGMEKGNPGHNAYQPLLLDSENFSVRWSKSRSNYGLSEAATGNGRIYFTDGSGVVALNAEDGEPAWTHPVVSNSFSAPGFANNRAYFRKGSWSELALVGLGGESGDAALIAPSQFYSSYENPPTIFEHSAYISGDQGGMLTVDIGTGNVLWEADDGTFDWGSGWEPAVDENGIYVVAEAGIRAIGKTGGDILFDIPAPADLPVQTLVLGSRGNVLARTNLAIYNFDIASQALAWQTPSLGYRYNYIAAGAGKVFAIADSELVVFDETDGRFLWHWSPGYASLQNEIVVTATHVFVTDGYQTYAIDLQTQESVWQYQAGGGLSIGREGALFIVDYNFVTAIDIEGDRDADGMPDWWERRYGGSLDPDGNADLDALTNIEEFNARTNPLDDDTDADGLSDSDEINVHSSNPLLADSDGDGLGDDDEVNLYETDPASTDSDADGISDQMEIANALDPNNAGDAELDNDSDGYSNLHEAFANTDMEDNTSVPAPTDWAMLQGNASHNGYQPLLLDANVFGERWTVNLATSNTSIAATGGGKIFITEGADVIGISADTGEEVWRNPVVESTRRLSAPSIADDVVYVHSGDNLNRGILGLDSGSGESSLELSNGANAYSPPSQPTIYNNQLMFTNAGNGGLLGVDLSVGEVLWELDAATAGLTDQSEPAVNEQGIFVVADNKLRKLEFETGAVTSEIETLGLPSQTPVLASDGSVLVEGFVIYSLDPADERIKWRTIPGDTRYTNIAVGNGQVYALNNGQLYVFNETNGRLLWTWSVSGDSLRYNIVVTASHVFVADSDTTYALDVKTREEVWSFNLAGHLSIGREGALFIVRNNSVTAIDIEGDSDADGLPDWWERRHGGDLDPSADADSDSLSNFEEFEAHTNPLLADTDGDGLSDADEVNTYLTDPLNTDSDNDGIGDDDEVNLYLSNPLLADTDGDTLDDYMETFHGLDPNDGDDAFSDNDGDGFSNLHEVFANTGIDDISSYPTPSDWGMEQANPRHSGYQPYLLDEANFELRWERSGFDFQINPIALGGGKVYVSSRQYYNDIVLMALRAEDGRTAWTREFEDTQMMTSPAYANSVVHVQGGNYNSLALLSIDVVTGEEISSLEHDSWDSGILAPTVVGDHAYVRGDYSSQLIAFDLTGGTQLWSTNLASQSNNWIPAVSNDYVFHPSDDGIVARDRLDGSEQFIFDAPAYLNTYVLGTKNNLFAWGSRLYSLDVSTGGVNWRVKSGTLTGLPAVGNGRVYYLSSGRLYAVNEVTGQAQWNWQPDNEYLDSNIVATVSHIFVSSGSTTYALSAHDGSLLWSFDTGGNLALGADSALYISNESRIAVLDLRGDSDGDDMPDWWEELRGLNAEDPDDAPLDADSDNVTNLEEFQNSADPNTPDTDGDGLEDDEEIFIYSTDPVEDDSDHDALPDGWEVDNGFDPLSAADAQADADGDSMPNYYEFLEETDPNDETSFISPIVSETYSFEDQSLPAGWTLSAESVSVSVTDSESSDGTYSVQTSSNAAISFNDFFAGNEFSIDVKSTCSNDYLHLLVDGEETAQQRITTDWAAVTAIIPYGRHTITIQVNTGCDVYLDNVRFNALESIWSLGVKMVSVNANSDILLFLDHNNEVVRQVNIPEPSRTQPGDLAVMDNGKVALFDTGGKPWLRLYDTNNGVWSTLASPDWNISSQNYVGLAAWGNYVYVTSQIYNGTGLSGIIRFDTVNMTLDTIELANVNDVYVGLNDVLYVLARTSVYLFDPDTLDALGSANVQNARALAAAENGDLFIGTTSGQILHYDESRLIVDSLDSTNAYDIDIRQSGEIILSNRGSVSLTNEELVLPTRLDIAGYYSAFVPDTDSDGDSIPDWWEIYYGYDVDGAADAMNDDDADNLTNADEYDLGTSPLLSDSDGDELSDYEEIYDYATNPLNQDSDGDSLRDGDEVFLYLTDPAEADSDGDGFSDGSEVNLYNTDPVDDGDFPSALNPYYESFEEIPTGWAEPLGSNAPWYVDTNTSSLGAGSLRSGDIGDGEVSLITLTGLFSLSTLTFDGKVDSENCCDYLNVYLDDVIVLSNITNFEWQNFSFDIPEGEHTVRFEYRKDGSVSDGQDAAWIDNLIIE